MPGRGRAGRRLDGGQVRLPRRPGVARQPHPPARRQERPRGDRRRPGRRRPRDHHPGLELLPPARGRDPPVGRRGRGVSRRILVAEPSRTLATLIQLTLRGVGAELEFATDGREALTAARDRTPDLLVTEAALPGLDGYSLVHALRSLPGCATTPVLLTVAGHTTPDPERLAYLGISDVLSKPFERAALLERVRALLDLAPGVAEAPAEPEPRDTRRVDRPTFPFEEPAPTRGTPPPTLDARVATEVSRQLDAAVGEAVERVLPTLVEAAVERALAPLVEQAVAARLPDLVHREVDQVLPSFVSAAVEILLHDALEAELPGAVATLAGPPLREASEAAVKKALPDLLRSGGAAIGPWVETVLRDVLPTVVPDIAERIVWKMVPEMAEDIIREEIRRLTEEGEQ
ncbi:MAG: response regulator [Deltaproteobacteria bacterium]|nr:MAG: response regulator [Deltaproteobacteria bacterium]